MGTYARTFFCCVWVAQPCALDAWNRLSAGHPGEAAVTLALSFCALLIPALWSRDLRTFFLSLVPLALVAPFVAAYAALYKAPVLSGLLQSIAGTDIRIELEEARHYGWALALGLAGSALYVWAALRLARVRLHFRTAACVAALWSVVIQIYLPYASFWLWLNHGI